MTPYEFGRALYGIAFEAGISEQFYAERLWWVTFLANAFTFATVLLAVVSVSATVASFSPTSKIGKWFRPISCVASLISILLAIGLIVWPPFEAVSYHKEMRQRWADIRSDARNLHTLFKQDVGGNLYVHPENETHDVPDRLVALLTRLQQKADTVKSLDLTPSDEAIRELEQRQTEKMWGHNIRSQEQLEEFISNLQASGQPIPAPNI